MEFGSITIKVITYWWYISLCEYSYVDLFMTTTTIRLLFFGTEMITPYKGKRFFLNTKRIEGITVLMIFKNNPLIGNSKELKEYLEEMFIRQVDS